MGYKNALPRQLHDSITARKVFTSTEGTTITDIYTVPSGQENECYIHSIILNSTDAGANVVSFYIHNGTEYNFIGSRSVAASGNLEVIASTTVLLNRMLKDLANNYYLRLKPGEKLAAKMGTALTGGETMQVDMDGSSFKRST